MPLWSCPPLFAPWISPYSPVDMDLYSRLKPPSLKHPLGTDELGRDLLSRIIWGARVSLKVGVISVGIGMILGVFLGLIGGYFGGVTEKTIFGVVDLLLSMPSLLLALAIVATLGPGITQVMVAVGISLVPAFARVTRGSVLTVKEQNYVLGAKALGASHFDIMTRYILPNVITPIIVLATLNLRLRADHGGGPQLSRHRGAASRPHLGIHLKRRANDDSHGIMGIHFFRIGDHPNGHGIQFAWRRPAGSP